jgi:hypothetical protein
MNKILFYLIFILFIIILLLYIHDTVNDGSFYTKEDVFRYINVDYPKTIALGKNDKLPNITYPVVMKPSVKSGVSKGVKLIHNKNEAIEYINNFDWSIKDKIIVQEKCRGANDGSVSYYRDPFTGEQKINYITKITFTHPDKYGNYSRINRDNKLNYAQVDHTSVLLTPENEKVFFDIFSRIPNLDYGRMDIIWENDDDLRAGKNFCIVEINKFGGDVRVPSQLKNVQRLVDFYQIFQLGLKKASIFKLGNPIRFLINLPDRCRLGVYELKNN